MPESVATSHDFLTDRAALVDRALIERLNAFDLPQALSDAIAYALAPGGKRMRPVLALLCAEAVGGRVDDALDAAVAIEFVHNFSLIHDDLPALDDDALRRGRPTLHVHAGEAMAVLAGDALLSMALEIAASCACGTRSAPGRSGDSRIVVELTCATTAMIGGQVEDMNGMAAGSGDDADHADAAAQLEHIHRGKTGALFRASCRIGGMCAGADDAVLRALTAYSESIGLMFQIVDDLLDVTQPASHTGKATGKDVKAGKLTYPAVHGIDASRRRIADLRDRACAAVAPLGAGAEQLRILARHLAGRTR